MCVESHVALGRLDLAADDAAAMLAVATPRKAPGLKARALDRRALVEMRRGEVKEAVKTATSALATARRARNGALVAKCLLRLAEAQHRASLDAAARTAQEALDRFNAAGDDSGAGRAQWVVALQFLRAGKADDARRAAQAAVDLCQRVGDSYGVGNALNALAQTDIDIGETIRHGQQAIQAFETAGYVERKAISTSNLAIYYADLGLYPHARRLHEDAVRTHRSMGSNLSQAYALENLGEVEVQIGALDAASRHCRQLSDLVSAFGDPVMESALPRLKGEIALAAGDPQGAARHFDASAKVARKVSARLEHVMLTRLGSALLASGSAVAALKATTRATTLHRGHAFAAPDGLTSQEIWWRHAQALSANKRAKEARDTLARAHGFLLERIATLRDEGLRRNYLNKVAVNREILAAWLDDSARRKLSKDKALAHLAIESNVREPFQRLADTGLRLNALHTAREIEVFVVEEATELTGGERVLLLLEVDGKPTVAEAMHPRGENTTAVLRSIGTHLERARTTRTVHLIHTPQAAVALKQRSRIVAPLIAQNRVLGYLYADIDGVYGRFSETDRDMLGMLANQAAVALDNAQWAQALEAKVEQRTAELSLSNARLEQRNAELAIVNSVQQGLASELHFQAIVDVVGDKLREVFTTPNLGITWYDSSSNLIHYLYAYEHGKRLDVKPRPRSRRLV